MPGLILGVDIVVHIGLESTLSSRATNHPPLQRIEILNFRSDRLQEVVLHPVKGQNCCSMEIFCAFLELKQIHLCLSIKVQV